MANKITIPTYAKPNTSSSAPKIRKMTDVEQNYASISKKYTKNGKVTWGGAVSLMGDMIKTSIRRSLGMSD
jgi:hypothetical protein